MRVANKKYFSLGGGDIKLLYGAREGLAKLFRFVLLRMYILMEVFGGMAKIFEVQMGGHEQKKIVFRWGGVGAVANYF